MYSWPHPAAPNRDFLEETTDLPPVDDPPDVGDWVGVVGQAPEVKAVSEEAGVRTLDGHEAGRNWKEALVE